MDNLYKTQVNLEIDYKSVKSEEFDWESRHYKNINIKYEINLEYKNWGINGISCSLLDQELELEAEVMFHNKEESEYISLKIKVENTEVEHQKTFSNGVICPSELEVKLNSITKVSDGKYVAIAKGKLIFPDSLN
jgi:hypothetical protein